MINVKIIILILIFFYFFKLGNNTPIKGINYLIVFFCFYYLVKFSFVYIQDNIVALWVDAAILGFCIPSILSTIDYKIIPNPALLLKIVTYLLYGIIMIIIGLLFNEISLFKSLDSYRAYMLFPILTYTAFLITIKNIDSTARVVISFILSSILEVS